MKYDAKENMTVMTKEGKIKVSKYRYLDSVLTADWKSEIEAKNCHGQGTIKKKKNRFAIAQMRRFGEVLCSVVRMLHAEEQNQNFEMWYGEE